MDSSVSPTTSRTALHQGMILAARGRIPDLEGLSSTWTGTTFRFFRLIPAPNFNVLFP